MVRERRPSAKLLEAAESEAAQEALDESVDEEAATACARSEYGRADAAKLLQPRPAPTAAGAEVI